MPTTATNPNTGERIILVGGQWKPYDEEEFQRWYGTVSRMTGINTDPDDPNHFYDYRTAYAAGANPLDDEDVHWPSEFKDPNHPNRYVEGIDTITGQPAKTATNPKTKEKVFLHEGLNKWLPLEQKATDIRPGKTLIEGTKDVVRNALMYGKGLFDYTRSLDEQAMASLPEETREKIESQRAKKGLLGRAIEILPEESESISETLGGAAQSDALRRDESLKRPEGVKGYLQDFTRMFPQVISQAGVYGVAGPAAATGFMGSQIAGGKYEELEKQGVDPVRNFQASLADAAMQAPLEAISLGKALSVWKPGKTGLKVVRDIVEASGTEFVTEWLQKYPELATNIWAKSKGATTSERVDEFVSKFWQATKEGMYEGAVAAPFGGLLRGGKVYSDTRADKKTPTAEPESPSAKLRNDIESGALSKEDAMAMRERIPDDLRSVIDDALDITKAPVKEGVFEPQTPEEQAGIEADILRQRAAQRAKQPARPAEGPGTASKTQIQNQAEINKITAQEVAQEEADRQEALKQAGLFKPTQIPSAAVDEDLQRREMTSRILGIREGEQTLQLSPGQGFATRPADRALVPSTAIRVPPEGSTATNPKTGEKIVLKGGSWVPVERVEVDGKTYRKAGIFYVTSGEQVGKWQVQGKNGAWLPIKNVERLKGLDKALVAEGGKKAQAEPPNLRQAPERTTEKPVVKESLTPEQVSEQEGLIYNGPQEGADGTIRGHLFTDPNTKGTFMVRGEKPTAEEVRERRDTQKKTFEGQATYKKGYKVEKPTELTIAPEAKAKEVDLQPKPPSKPAPVAEAPKAEPSAKSKPGSVFIKEKQFPFREYREITRKGKNQGKVEVVLPTGKKIVPREAIARWPEKAEAAEAAVEGRPTGKQRMEKAEAAVPKAEAAIGDRKPTVEDNLDLSDLNSFDRIVKVRERFPSLSASEQLRLSVKIKEASTGSTGEGPKGSKFIEPRKDVLTVGGQPIGPSEARYIKREAKKRASAPVVEEKKGGEKASRLKSLLKDEKGAITIESTSYREVMDNLTDIGRDIYASGKKMYSDFKAAMRSALSDIWAKIRHLIGKVFMRVRQTMKDETGAVGRDIKPDKTDALIEKYFGKQLQSSTTKGIAPQKNIDIEKSTKSKVAFQLQPFDLTKEGIKNQAARVYANFFMREYPIVRFAMKAGKFEAKQIEEQIRRTRGAGGITEAILTAKSKTPFINLAKDGITEYSHLGDTSLQKILKPLKTKDLYQDYERLREAERDIAFDKYRQDDIKAGKLKGIDPDNSKKVVALLKQKYGDQGYKDLQDISRAHTKFEQDAVLKTLLKSGWMSQEQYDAITSRPESEFYASYLREMEDVDRETVGSGGDPVKRIYGSEKRKLPSTEGTIGNILRTVRLVEKLRLNKQVVALKDISPDLAQMIVEKKPRFRATEITFPRRDAKNKFILGANGKRVYQTKKVAVPIGPPANTITVAENGKKQYYELPSDVLSAIDNYTPKEMNALFKLMTYPTRLLRAGATLSAEFIMRNPSRDQMTAYVYSKYGYNPFTDFAKGLFHTIGKTDLYNEFQAAGGENSFFVSLDRGAVNLRARDMTGQGNKIKYLKNPVEALRVLSEFTEKGTRVGLYQKAKAKGATTGEAMTEAREGTLDFGRIGNERAINQIIAFWNASLQGTDKMFREMKNGRAVTKAFLGITIPSLALWWVNHDDERYKELPAWRKNFFWNFIVDDGPIISVPKPFELGLVFGSLPERIMDWIFLNDPDSMKDIAVALGEGIMPSLFPTAGLPLVEHITNYSFFRGQNLEPKSMDNLPNWMRYTSGTTALAKKAGEITDVSPIKIENWIRDWTGTLGYGALAGFDKVFMGDDVPDVGKDWYEIAPGIKGFIAREPIGSGSKSVEQFYENTKEAFTAEAGYKFLAKHQNNEAVMFAKKEREKIMLSKGARDEMERMTEIRKQMNSIIDNKKISSTEKRKQIDRLSKLMTQRAKQFNQVYNQMMKGALQ